MRTLTALLLLLLLPLTAAAQPSPDPPRVLIVVTSHDQLGDTGRRTGAYFSEITHPYAVFTEQGYAVDIVSPKGGSTPLIAAGTRDSVTTRLLYDADFMGKLGNAKTPDAVDPADYAAIYFAGGHGAMWDLPDATSINEMTAAIFEQGGTVGGVCHGPAGLVNVRLSDGSYLVAGRTVSAFTNEEEEAAEATDLMPFLLETRLRERGATFSEGPKWDAHIAVSGRLITGQNPASATDVAEAMVEALESSARP
jgi:putative intracellular protease/amidase